MCPSLCPRPSGLAKLFPPRRTALAAGCYAPLLGIRFTPKLALSLRLSSDPTKYRKFVPRRSGLGDFFLRFVYHLSKYWVLKCSPGVRFDAQGRPEGGVGRGDVYSVGPTPTLPLVRAPSFSRADAASPRRRPRVGPGRPQGTNPRNMSIPRPRHDGLSIPSACLYPLLCLKYCFSPYNGGFRLRLFLAKVTKRVLSVHTKKQRVRWRRGLRETVCRSYRGF